MPSVGDSQHREEMDRRATGTATSQLYKRGVVDRELQSRDSRVTQAEFRRKNPTLVEQTTLQHDMYAYMLQCSMYAHATMPYTVLL